VSQNLVIENGKITLPPEVVGRYHLNDDTPVRMIETPTGIVLIPLTQEPMSNSLQAEIEEWQELAAETLGMFPFEGDEP
jgi:hypothetical protein